MPSRRQILVATPALLATPAILRSSRARAADRVIDIGYELPLTGQYSDYGIRFRNSAMLAMDEFKAASRLPGAEVTIVYARIPSPSRGINKIARLGWPRTRRYWRMPTSDDRREDPRTSSRICS